MNKTSWLLLASLLVACGEGEELMPSAGVAGKGAFAVTAEARCVDGARAYFEQKNDFPTFLTGYYDDLARSLCRDLHADKHAQPLMCFENLLPFVEEQEQETLQRTIRSKQYAYQMTINLCRSNVLWGDTRGCYTEVKAVVGAEPFWNNYAATDVARLLSNRAVYMCRGVQRYDAPARCYQQASQTIGAYAFWNRYFIKDKQYATSDLAVRLCRSTVDASASLDCLSSHVVAGGEQLHDVRVAVAACARTFPNDPPPETGEPSWIDAFFSGVDPFALESI